MNIASHNKIVSFIWSIADDCLRDVYVRGKYRDVILPMVVLRRLDALLEISKDAVMQELRFQTEDAGFTELDDNGLQEASGYVFYNTSKWTLQLLHDTATNSQQFLESNFKEYIDGFSTNVKEIITKFKLRSQINHMANKDVLLAVLEKFTSPYINLTSFEKNDPEGRKLPPLSNLGMGYVFEELIRKFNEDWASEVKYIKDGNEVIDKRFLIKLKNYWGIEDDVEAVPRSSDWQLLFLMEMVDKMKPAKISATGSRIASVHNGSSLFTGDAGGGESNIRRYIIENDLLEAIIQLPNNFFLIRVSPPIYGFWATTKRLTAKGKFS